MSRKVYFRYNERTDSYERVYPDRLHRIKAAVRQCLWGVLSGAVVVGVFLILSRSGTDAADSSDSEKMQQQINRLNKRADQALAVMDNLAERDNNFYRVLMQTEPLSPGQRLAGLERQRVYSELDSMAADDRLRLLEDKYDVLDRLVYKQVKSYDYLRSQAGQQQDRTDRIPSIQPVSQNKMRAMASGYGYRRDPVYGTTKFHEGMDFSAPIGTPVYATGNGKVTDAGWRSAYGNLIDIDHGYNYTTRYAHLSEILVSPGQTVKRGDLIGRVGNTGKSTGPHLHYEVRLNGEPQNPVHYYFNDLTPDEYDRMIQESENAGHVMD
ncbi:MAG: M23 family metallopeptidase [Muribaculaceae bacterium]|nr:M23 family metallopeptidase [Muribaculaceae bacterium]